MQSFYNVTNSMRERSRRTSPTNIVNNMKAANRMAVARAQINRLLANLKLESTLELAERSFGLSLSDRYLINDKNNPQLWDDINFFDNDFPDDLGFLTLGQDVSSPSEHTMDSDTTHRDYHTRSPQARRSTQACSGIEETSVSDSRLSIT